MRTEWKRTRNGGWLSPTAWTRRIDAYLAKHPDAGRRLRAHQEAMKAFRDRLMPGSSKEAQQDIIDLIERSRA